MKHRYKLIAGRICDTATEQLTIARFEDHVARHEQQEMVITLNQWASMIERFDSHMAAMLTQHTTGETMRTIIRMIADLQKISHRYHQEMYDSQKEEHQ
jgi:hypothetical protein